MPIYEYACKSCKTTFEQLVKRMSEGGKVVTCPKCGSKDTGRALSVFAVGASAASSHGNEGTPGMCCQCGEPGPCAMDN